MSDHDPGATVPADFAEHEADRYTEWLRARTGADWTDATGHRFVTELGDDTLADAVFRRYLVQDYAFVDALTSLVGHAAGHAPTVEARVELADFLTTVGTDEDEFFRRSFDALDVPEGDRTDPDLWAVTRAFEDLLGRAARAGYAESLAVLVPVEWVYLEWATAAAEEPRPDRFYLDEWIDLHAVPAFREFVGWLREALDDVGPALSPRRAQRVDRLFRRSVELEVAFFDATFQHE
ncbi:TenA family protein [Haloglomus halophilum]|uniref:TenA family protein n=1 Tax=Haloglomus halophilum TaxID=2962672 RepID=UPI0020C9A778|nr:TenA family protein [Haloglomus halophilum]